VGGGFGGLAAAKALRKTNAQVVLIDRQNHHLFQPLLYQVATSVLSPGQIASPIREILKAQRNTTVLLGEVTGVDADRRRVFVDSVDRERIAFEYDYLILATGASHSYFGHDEFEQFAPGLKSLADAVSIRNQVLLAFEQAEAEEDPQRHRDLLTFVLVGAGPTGVEMASALADLVRSALRSEFRRIDPTSARIVLIDMGSRVLATFSEKLSAAARRRLEKLGVEGRLGHGVDQNDSAGRNVGRRHRGRRTHGEQDRDLGGRGDAVASRQVARGGDGSRRPRPRAAGSHRERPPRNFRGRRHRVARSGRSSAARRGAGRDAAGTL